MQDVENGRKSKMNKGVEEDVFNKDSVLRLENRFFSLSFSPDGILNSFLDKRNGGEMTDGENRFGTIDYTLFNEDITTQKNKPPFTPYSSRQAEFGSASDTGKSVVLYSEELQSRAEYECLPDGGVKICFEIGKKDVSEYGLNFPFNFSGKLRGGDWKKQLLFSSPYNSADNKSLLVYLTRPDGNHLALIGDGNVDGWKMDYSPYIFGHFFINLKWIGNFDRAYSRADRAKKSFSVYMYAVKTYRDALEKMYEITGIPVANYKVSSGYCGEETEIEVIGKCDGVKIEGENKIYPVKDGKAKILLSRYGLHSVYPVYDGGKKGADCVVFAFRNIRELFGDNLKRVGNEPIPEQLSNLCEGWTWVNTAVDYMCAYGKNSELEHKVQNALFAILTQDENKAIPHCTIFMKESGGYPPYNVFHSNRIQEGFTGIWMMLDLYRLYREEKYLKIALNMCENYLAAYQAEDGGLKRVEAGKLEDYTTVCAPLVVIVDATIAAEAAKDPRAEDFKKRAKKTAEYLYRRGFSFPTEGGTSDLTQPEFEDGSISCTALSLIYYCYKLESNEEYLRFAKEILEIHNAWEMYTQIAPMKNSSLRWWETCWADFGPSLCCGHCWTIWRAEADFWYGLLFADPDSMIRSYNGFFSNFSKQTQDGKLYGTYIIDYITGGGFDYSVYDRSKKNKPRFEITNRTLAPVEDITEARYCYNRMYHTWFKCVAVIGNRTLFARRRGEEILRDSPELKLLFVADYDGKLKIGATEQIKVCTKEKFSVLYGVKKGEYVFPQNGEILLNFQSPERL